MGLEVAKLTRYQFELVLSKESPSVRPQEQELASPFCWPDVWLGREPPLTTSAFHMLTPQSFCKIDSLFVCQFGAIFDPSALPF